MPGERAAEITLSFPLTEVKGVKLEKKKIIVENTLDLLSVLIGGNSRIFLYRL